MQKLTNIKKRSSVFTQVVMPDRTYFVYALFIEEKENYYIFGLKKGEDLFIFDIRMQSFFAKIESKFNKTASISKCLDILKKEIQLLGNIDYLVLQKK